MYKKRKFLPYIKYIVIFICIMLGVSCLLMPKVTHAQYWRPYPRIICFGLSGHRFCHHQMRLVYQPRCYLRLQGTPYSLFSRS